MHVTISEVIPSR